jgi:hypothetical protein
MCPKKNKATAEISATTGDTSCEERRSQRTDQGPTGQVPCQVLIMMAPVPMSSKQSGRIFVLVLAKAFHKPTAGIISLKF